MENTTNLKHCQRSIQLIYLKHLIALTFSTVLKVNYIVHRGRLRLIVLTFSATFMVNSTDLRRRLMFIQFTLNAALKVVV